MGILVNKLVNWVYLIRARAQIGFICYVKVCYLGTQIKPSNHVSMLLAPADIVGESSLYNTIQQQLYINNYI